MSLSFRCEEPGLFADVDSGCEFFHVCHADPGANRPRLVSTQPCPAGTLFSQPQGACDTKDQVACELLSMADQGFGGVEQHPPRRTRSSPAVLVDVVREAGLLNRRRRSAQGSLDFYYADYDDALPLDPRGSVASLVRSAGTLPTPKQLYYNLTGGGVLPEVLPVTYYQYSDDVNSVPSVTPPSTTMRQFNPDDYVDDNYEPFIETPVNEVRPTEMVVKVAAFATPSPKITYLGSSPRYVEDYRKEVDHESGERNAFGSASLLAGPAKPVGPTADPYIPATPSTPAAPLGTLSPAPPPVPSPPRPARDPFEYMDYLEDDVRGSTAQSTAPPTTPTPPLPPPSATQTSGQLNKTIPARGAVSATSTAPEISDKPLRVDVPLVPTPGRRPTRRKSLTSTTSRPGILASLLRRIPDRVGLATQGSPLGVPQGSVGGAPEKATSRSKKRPPSTTTSTTASLPAERSGQHRFVVSERQMVDVPTSTSTTPVTSPTVELVTIPVTPSAAAPPADTHSDVPSQSPAPPPSPSPVSIPTQEDADSADTTTDTTAATEPTPSRWSIAAPGKPFVCTGRELKTFYADPGDCRLFHYCSPGFSGGQVLDFRFRCEDGTVYEAELHRCAEGECPARLKQG